MHESAAQKRFLRRRLQNRRLVRTMRILILVVFLALWELSARMGWIDSFIFSSPSQLLATFSDMMSRQNLAAHIGITLLETLASFFLVIAAGTSAAILLWCCPRLSSVLEPYLVMLNSLPKSALAPLLIVWLGANMRTIIVAGMSVAIFGSIISLYTGFQETDPDKLKLIYSLGGRKRDTLLKVVLPSSIPLLLATMKVNIGLCLVGVVIGEFIGARRGLGYLIIYSSQTFKLDAMILSILILCVIAMALYGAVNLAEKKCLRGRPS